MRVLFCQRNKHPEEVYLTMDKNKPDKDVISEKVCSGEWAEGHLTEDVVIIYNPNISKKLLINRIITEDTEPVAYIKGDFFICWKSPEGYRGLTEDEVDRIDPCVQLSEIEIFDIREALRGDNNS